MFKREKYLIWRSSPSREVFKREKYLIKRSSPSREVFKREKCLIKRSSSSREVAFYTTFTLLLTKPKSMGVLGELQPEELLLETVEAPWREERDEVSSGDPE